MIVNDLCISLGLHIISDVVPYVHLINWCAIISRIEVHSFALMSLNLTIVGPNHFPHN